MYCRDRPGTSALRDELLEAHWSFMDDYADGMIARGPTLTPDLATATGSLHIVDLPDADAARAFAFEEPNYRAGVYADVLIRRWHNALGATMWDFDGDPATNRRFLVLGEDAVPSERFDAYLLESSRRAHLIADLEIHDWEFGGRR